MTGTVHVIGAGLSGLSAAVRLVEAGRRVHLHEAAGQAGGRCRSYHDPALGMMIDNGNHLVLSGNQAAMDFTRLVGGLARLDIAPAADFPFADITTGERWTLRINDGRLPWWIFAPSRRVPGTGWRDYLALGALLKGRRDQTISDVIACRGPVFERLLGPVLVSALNIEAQEGTAALAAAVIRESVARGGRACRPVVAHEGLSAAFVDPALDWLKARGAMIDYGQRLRAVTEQDGRVTALDFGEATVPLAPEDAVVLSVPPVVARALVPGLAAPDDFRAIVNVHFRTEPPPGQPRLMGTVGGATEWIFAFENRLSVTISAGDRFLETPREELAAAVWREVAAACHLDRPLPPWQIVREKRATFAATPQQEKLRPGPETAWRNLVLAGDWTDTGLPATIEGAIRSGARAAHTLNERIA